MKEGRSACKILTGKPTEKISLGRPSVDVRAMLEWILKKCVSFQGIGYIKIKIKK